jgi:hypothetical protein
MFIVGEENTNVILYLIFIYCICTVIVYFFQSKCIVKLKDKYAQIGLDMRNKHIMAIKIMPSFFFFIFLRLKARV